MYPKLADNSEGNEPITEYQLHHYTMFVVTLILLTYIYDCKNRIKAC